MLGEGHEWSVAGEFLAAPNVYWGGGGGVGWKLMVEPRRPGEPLEKEIGVGNERRWTEKVDYSTDG